MSNLCRSTNVYISGYTPREKETIQVGVGTTNYLWAAMFFNKNFAGCYMRNLYNITKFDINLAKSNKLFSDTFSTA